MAWFSHAARIHISAPSCSSTPSTWSTLERLRYFAIALLLLICIMIAFSSFAIVIFLVPNPEPSDWTPVGVKCATCTEIMAHNPVLARQRDINRVGQVEMGCLGVNTYQNDAQQFNVTFGEMKRCWALETGKDEWLNPLGNPRWGFDVVSGKGQVY